MVGIAVFKIVESSISMKNATATNHGNKRLALAVGVALGIAWTC